MAEIDSRLDTISSGDRLGRLRFRAWRRGFREADLVLGPFVEAVGGQLSDDDISALEALLAHDDDHTIYAWIIGTLPTPPEYDTPMMTQLQAFMRDHVATAVAEGAG